jgi:purine-binding chemotaxis protein CheW
VSEQQRGSPLRRLVTTGGLVGTTWNEPEGSTDAELKLAGFHVGDGLYGIDIMRIKEVIQSRPYPIRAVPHAPALVEGVIQLRGVVIPVVDLRKRFGAPTPTGNEKLEKLIIVSVRGRIVGLKVDRIVGELRVPAGGLRPAPSMLRPSGHSGPEFFTGVCRVAEGMVFVVNLEALIDPRVIPPPADDGNPNGPDGKQGRAGAALHQEEDA